jgi:hypothetical protein
MIYQVTLLPRSLVLYKARYSYIGGHVLKTLFSRVFSVGSGTHCDPSARFIVGVHTARSTVKSRYKDYSP